MTNERRHDKESSAGGHRKRTKLRVKRPRWSIRDVSTALAEVAKVTGLVFAHVFRLSMSSRFESEEGHKDRRRSLLMDPEACDATEQQFSASLEGPSTHPRFVVTPESSISREAQSPRGLELSKTALERLATTPQSSNCESAQEIGASAGDVAVATTPEIAAAPFQPDLLAGDGPSSWRNEVAARLNNYRARRTPRGPRYPSMRLDFGPADPPTVTLARRQALALQSSTCTESVVTSAAPIAYPAPALTPVEPSAKIIEFPRLSPSQKLFDELAEPVLDRPRILEAPELVPPAPALGGILLEAVAERADERRPGFEMPLQPARMIRRVLAVTTDAVFVMLAFTAFAYIFLRVTPTVPPMTQSAGISIVLLGLFWAGYQYLLLVHAGSTPGLKLAKLELSRFDGAPVPRSVRRWRVLASVLSGISLGLGYAWCFLDEDQLCWHDRITRTYMAPKKSDSSH
jgi:uncharacterized RDD family membrane protein YckC